MGDHLLTTLAPDSVFVGQICPVSRQELESGQAVVVCADSHTAILAESWHLLEGYCPFCGPLAPAVLGVPEAMPSTPLTVSGAWLTIPGSLTYRLDRDVTNMGRSLDNHLVLTDPTVSQHHARIRRHGQGYYLFDLASAYGTWLGDRPVYRLILMDGDQIRLGETTLVFKQVTDRN